MEHPLVQVDPDLTVDQLQTKINELNKKLSVAIRSGNGHLAGQIRMALDSFNVRYQEKIKELYASASKAGTDFSDRINISS